MNNQYKKNTPFLGTPRPALELKKKGNYFSLIASILTSPTI